MLEPKYDHKKVETGKYENWKESNFPIVNKLISIVGDKRANIEFGTGVVKRTPFGTKLKNVLKVKGSLGYSY